MSHYNLTLLAFCLPGYNAYRTVWPLRTSCTMMTENKKTIYDILKCVWITHCVGYPKIRKGGRYLHFWKYENANKNSWQKNRESNIRFTIKSCFTSANMNVQTLPMFLLTPAKEALYSTRLQYVRYVMSFKMVFITEHTQSGNGLLLAYIPSWWKN